MFIFSSTKKQETWKRTHQVNAPELKSTLLSTGSFDKSSSGHEHKQDKGKESQGWCNGQLN